MIRSLLLGSLVVALMGSSALAADLYIPETPQPMTMSSNGFDWDGPYIGVTGGVYFEDGDAQGFVGAVAGVNFIVADPIVLGAELQGNYYFENDAFYGAAEVLALGKIGFLASDSVMIYAAGGFGYVWDTDSDEYYTYAAGVGIEAAITETVSLRGDILAMGYEGGDGFDGGRASVSVLFHF